MSPALCAFLAVLAVSLTSLLGIVALRFGAGTLRRLLLPLVALAAGTMIADAFLHLLPHAVEEAGGFSRGISLSVLAGMFGFFLLEKVIHWRHEHEPCDKEHVHPIATMNLVGDAFHNFLDGALIAGGFAGGDVTLGVTVAISVAMHEIPQEIGDFAVLVHAGYAPAKALLMNLGSALTSLVGAAAVFLLGDAHDFLVPFTAGAFVYIAASDLIPEIRREERPRTAALLLCAFAAGIALMAAIPDAGPAHAHVH